MEEDGGLEEEDGDLEEDRGLEEEDGGSEEEDGGSEEDAASGPRNHGNTALEHPVAAPSLSSLTGPATLLPCRRDLS